MTSRPASFRSLKVLESSHSRRALNLFARGGCLLMLASGAARANEPEAPDAPARAEAAEARVQAEAPVPAGDAAPADDAVWGEEALAQAELPAVMTDAARTLEEAPVVVCSGSLHQAYRPGLLLTTPRGSVQREALQFSGCPVNDGVVMTSVGMEAQHLKRATCIGGTGGASTATVTWSNGEKSSVVLERVEATLDGGMQVFTSEGTIGSGRHAGHGVRLVTAVPTLTTLAACVQPSGLTANLGVATLTVLDLPTVMDVPTGKQ
ncbi:MULTISPECIES: hypothetical protein [unclassified Corallococcus]|uniref:hypothetical protein n=1 Tax=unclassified Corallococcus TaxID=2685029 RepID=UPI001A8DBA88|nr:MULTISPECIES: hypothetical protein [unclassified Corallococcus]MBN9681037.1 hypothetical protein [Corallococcus sp. NCSPR001]WAS87369.1 hypothetical protein O0N60_10400 [Corallococcus sp. NCRR]